MKQDIFYLSSDNTTTIHAVEWIPEGSPAAVLQICHGMVEYIERYDEFASFMAENGFYVTGNDHLGHGRSVKDSDQLGFFSETNGNECVIKDIRSLEVMTRSKYPDIPYFMLGHSMGSFLVRQYIEMYHDKFSGIILTGTGSYSAPSLKAGKLLCSIAKTFKGSHYRSKLVDSLAFGSNNKKFEPARTPSDCLSRDEKKVDEYIADPLCGFKFTVNAYYNMFSGMEYAQKAENIKKVPRDLPILIASGSDDPVGDFGKGTRAAYDAYKKAGIKDLTLKLYTDDRHEILNELDREQVYNDLLDWIKKRM